MSINRAIYWFRTDLRVRDNPPLHRAINTHSEILPVYIIDERVFQVDQFGIDRISPLRVKFLLESLHDLKQSLRALGSDLFVKVGDPVHELKQLYQQYDCSMVHSQKACAYYECQDEIALSKFVNAEFTWGDTLIHIEDMPFEIEDLPDVYTPFRKIVEKRCDIRPLLEAPTEINTPEGFGTDIPTFSELGVEEPEIDPRTCLNFIGGETHGRNRIKYYLWDSQLVSTYHQTRNGLVGGDYSTKFSPWLAHGCISPRDIYWEIKKYEEQVEANKSTYWVIFELLWRDYFHFLALKYGKKLFLKNGISGVEKEWKTDNYYFEKWEKGRTNEPFINACMNELNATGFLGNRARQIAASFVVNNMNCDWRMGAAYYEKMLLDYDPCSNYGNWMYIAGVGTDARGGRKFNVDKQKKVHDPNREYQRLWKRKKVTN